MKKILIKINDTFGFISVCEDNHRNDLTSKETDLILGDGAYDFLNKVGKANYLTDEAYEFLINEGWVSEPDLDLSNGDVHVFGFKK